MSEEVLRSYLSRSMTTVYLLTGHGDFEDNLRMLTDCGVKFAGRAVYQCGREEGNVPACRRNWNWRKQTPRKFTTMILELMLQACTFEFVSSDVTNLSVRSWAFEELSRPVEAGNFQHEELI